MFNWLQGFWALSEIQDVQNDSDTKANPGVSCGAMLEQWCCFDVYSSSKEKGNRWIPFRSNSMKNSTVGVFWGKQGSCVVLLLYQVLECTQALTCIWCFKKSTICDVWYPTQKEGKIPLNLCTISDGSPQWKNLTFYLLQPPNWSMYPLYKAIREACGGSLYIGCWTSKGLGLQETLRCENKNRKTPTVDVS